MTLTRRTFSKNSAAAAGAGILGRLPGNHDNKQETPGKSIKITRVDSNFEREPLLRPFGFKGGYMTEIWQTAALLGSESGIHKIGLCSQSVLWSDARVFASHSESGGNALMYAMTEYAINLIKGCTFTDPVKLMDEIWPV